MLYMKLIHIQSENVPTQILQNCRDIFSSYESRPKQFTKFKVSINMTDTVMLQTLSLPLDLVLL